MLYYWNNLKDIIQAETEWTLFFKGKYSKYVFGFLVLKEETGFVLLNNWLHIIWFSIEVENWDYLKFLCEESERVGFLLSFSWWPRLWKSQRTTHQNKMRKEHKNIIQIKYRWKLSLCIHILNWRLHIIALQYLSLHRNLEQRLAKNVYSGLFQTKQNFFLN